MGTQRKDKGRGRGRCKWSKSDDAELFSWWGMRGLDDLARTFGRTPLGVRARARALGLGPARQGQKSLKAFAEATGYDDTRIRGAVARLGLRIARAPTMFDPSPPARGRAMVFTPEQEAEITAYLATIPDGRKLYSGTASATDAWQWGVGSKPDACRDCGRSSVQHAGGGRCRDCYQKARRARVRAERCAAGWKPRTLVATAAEELDPITCTGWVTRTRAA